MKKKILLIFIFISSVSFAQQNSKAIVIGNENEILSNQQGDSSKEFEANIYGNLNRIENTQTSSSDTKKNEDAKDFMSYATNIYIILGILASIVTIVSIFLLRRKPTNKKRK